MTLQADHETRIKVWRPAGFGGLELEVFENVRDYHDPKGVLSRYHFNVNFKGGAQLFYGGERHRFNFVRPLVLVQQPDEVYAADARGEPFSGWNLSVDEVGMRSVADALELHQGFPNFSELSVPSSLNDVLVRQLRQTIRAFDLPTTRLEREGWLLSALHSLVGLMSDTLPSTKRVKREHRAVKQAREILHECSAAEMSLASLALATGLSQGYLLRVFKLEVGVTPHVYQLDLRLDRAKELLARGVSAAQAANEAGFFDQSHLNHVFKKHTHVTPGQFQRESVRRSARGWSDEGRQGWLHEPH